MNRLPDEQKTIEGGKLNMGEWGSCGDNRET